jgi:farnesyl-diphosphate farnesyltransferase
MSEQAAAPGGETPDWLEGESDEWQFCWERLVEVSRTFSRPIDMLPGTLRVTVTCGYLLCRVADTVEDHPDLPIERRDDLYEGFLEVVERGADPERFTRPFSEIPGSGPEHELSENLEQVMAIFERLPEEVQRVCTRWIGEMTRGMQLYSHRPADEQGLVSVYSLADLERYCYYVAGTVGHMLTGLFLYDFEGLSDERRHAMRANAESFGLGLQLVNIVKDQTDDLGRARRFIPTRLIERAGLTPDALYEPQNRQRAHEVIAPIIDRAFDHLDDALAYTLAIPPERRQTRLFCLLPLWMAVRTLAHARGNDAMFIADEPVKISRPEVEQLIGECVQHASDDEALREQYEALKAE